MDLQIRGTISKRLPTPANKETKILQQQQQQQQQPQQQHYQALIKILKAIQADKYDTQSYKWWEKDILYYNNNNNNNSTQLQLYS